MMKKLERASLVPAAALMALGLAVLGCTGQESGSKPTTPSATESGAKDEAPGEYKCAGCGKLEKVVADAVAPSC